MNCCGGTCAPSVRPGPADHAGPANPGAMPPQEAQAPPQRLLPPPSFHCRPPGWGRPQGGRGCLGALRGGREAVHVAAVEGLDDAVGGAVHAAGGGLHHLDLGQLRTGRGAQGRRVSERASERSSQCENVGAGMGAIEGLCVWLAGRRGLLTARQRCAREAAVLVVGVRCSWGRRPACRIQQYCTAPCSYLGGGQGGHVGQEQVPHHTLGAGRGGQGACSERAATMVKWG